MSNKPLSNPITFTGQTPPWSLTQLDSNFSSIQAVINDTLSYSNYFVDQSGATNSVILSVPAALTVALTSGTLLFVKINNTNTGASTITINALVAQKIVNPDGSAMAPKQLLAGAIAILCYDGTNFQFVGSWLSPALRQTAAEIAAGVVPTDLSRGVEPYDIRRYGAKLDGVTDDTTAVNNALLVASQTVGSSLGSAILVPQGTCMLSSMVLLPNRVRVLGVNKRGSYFKATSGWTVGNSVAAWSSATTYATGNYVTQSGVLYVAKQASTNQTPPNTTYWNPIAPAMFYAQNGYAAGVGNSMFDSTLENLTVDANNIVGLGCVISSAWQEDCGLRGVLLLNFGTFGVRYQDGFGGASLSKVVDTEIFLGTIAGLTITGITAAASAVVTVSNNTGMAATWNPFIINTYVSFASVGGMTQINGLVGQVTAVGGSAGAWTATVNINSSAFGAYTSGGTASHMTGIDLSSPIGTVGAFMLDVSNSTVTGGTNNLSTCVACKGNSLVARSIHFEVTGIAILVDGVGFNTVQAASGATTVTTQVHVAAPFAGSLVMQNSRRNGATNFINDLRTGGYGAITGVDHPEFLINAISTSESAKGSAFASAWCTFDGTVAGTNAPTNGYNVTSVTRNSAGNYTITLLRAMQSANVAAVAASNLTSNGAQIATQLLTSTTFKVIVGVAGVATDASEVKAVAFGG